MLKTGKEHLECLRDGRVVYVGKERIDDVTTHPAFRNAAATVAALYDAKAAPENRDAMTFEEDGERFSAYYLPARTRADLEQRTETHRRIAEMTYGFMGRSPDHVSAFVTGMAMNPGVFNEYADNLLAYYRHMRRNDVYATYAVLPPQAARNPEFYQRNSLPIPSLRVVREEDDGVVISGMKMLATAGVFSDEIWIGNLIPLAPEQKDQSVTCAIPVNAPGVSLWARKPFERHIVNAFDNPLTARFDESDSMVICDNVKVPWERVFVHNDAVKARGIYIETPAHCYGNHQSNVRYWVKLQMLAGLAAKITYATGADQVPAVRETLGRLASLEALLGGLVAGQIQSAERWPEGYLTYNRRQMYAALNWCTESYSAIIDCIRELCGGGVFQMPADISVMQDPALAPVFQTYWTTPQISAVDRMRVFKLAWDVVGSEFAGRHQQYEKFYAGASFIVRGYNYSHAPWDRFQAIVDEILAGMPVPQAAVPEAGVPAQAAS